MTRRQNATISRTKARFKLSARAALGFAHAIVVASASTGCNGLFNEDKEQPKAENASPDGAAGSVGSAGSHAGAGGNAGASTGPDAGSGMAGAAPSGGETGTPVSRDGSERGAGCSVKNDCQEGLSCILGICQPPSFELVASAKECFQIDCKNTADCCGDLATEVPEQCRSRAAKCSERLPGCNPGECTRSGDCGGSGICTGHCSISSGECTGNVDCLANKCIEGQCSLDFGACRIDVDCALNTCASGTCACENPTFDPEDPVCSDPDCDGLCLWDCERSRCMISPACENNDHCFGATPLCVEGSCAECNADIDCSFDKVCRKGRCETPCRSDLHCGLFEACDKGECIFVGCRSDRECTLIPDAQALGFPPGLDSRLLRCHTEDGVGRCLIPCQTDAQCPPTEVCTGGLCKYIGCEADHECKTIAGVHNQDRRAGQPWVSTVECREAETDK